MEKVGLIAVFDVSNFNKGLKEYLSGVNDVNKETTNAESSGFSFARALETTVGNALLQVANLAVEAAGAIFKFGADSIGVAANFESSLATLQTAAASTGMSMAELGDIAIAVGADSSILGASASGAAEAMTGLYKSGLDTGAIFGDLEGYLAGTAELGGALRASFDLAAATTLDVSQAADLAAVSLATFGGELTTSAEKSDFINGALDNLVKAADASVAEVDGLAQALIFAGPAAADAGYSFEDTTNALAIMSTRGIQASMAGTGLRQMLASLKSPTDKAQAAIDELGLTLRDTTTGELLPLPDIIGNLNVALEDMDAAERDAALGAIFTTNGLAALSPLLAEGTDGWYAMAEATENAAGIQEQAALKSQTFAGQMEALDGQIETLQIQFGMALLPALTGFIEAVLPIIEQHGPQLQAIFEQVGIVLEGLVNAFFAFLDGNITGGLAEIGETIAGVFGSDAQQKFNEFIPIIQEIIPQAIEFLKNAFDAGFTFISGIVQQFRDFFVTISPFINTVVSEAIVIFEALKANVDNIWGAISAAISAVLDIVLGLITAFLGQVSGDWEMSLTGLQQFTQGIVDALVAIFDFLVATVATLMGTTVEDVKTKMITALAFVSDTATKLVAIFLSILNSASTSAQQLVVILVGLLLQISNFGQNVVDTISGVFSGAWEVITTFVGQAFQVGADIVNGIVNGITSAAGAIADAIGGAIQGAIDRAKALLQEGSPSKVFFEKGVNINAGLAGGIAASSSLPQQALTSSVGSLVSSPVTNSTTTIDNSRSASIEINNNGNNGTDTTYFDVIGALGAVGLA